MGFLDTDALQATADVRREPFAFLVARGVLPEMARAALDADFPRYPNAGFFPHESRDCGAAVNALVDELTEPAFAEWIGAQLGIAGLGRRPSLVTI